jgi:dihydrofolate reductase
MRELVLIEYVSIDGVIQAPGHAAEDPDGNFAHGGWTRPFMDTHGRHMGEALGTMGALLLGRVTYDIWAEYWPTVTDPVDEIARMLNSVPKYVASRTLRHGGWPTTTVIHDVATQVAELKRQDGKEILVMGSAELAQTLMAEQMIGLEGHTGSPASNPLRPLTGRSDPAVLR